VRCTPRGGRRGGRRLSRGFPRPRHARQAVDNRADGGRRAYVTGSDDARARMRVRARYGPPPRRPASSLARLAPATSRPCARRTAMAAISDNSDEEREPTEAHVIPVHRRAVTRTRGIGYVARRHLGPRCRGDASHATLPGQARNRRGLEDAEASTPGDQRHRPALGNEPGAGVEA
jgi:hypothetical protein